MDELKVRIDDKEYIVKIEEEGNSLKIHIDGKVYTVDTSFKAEQKDYEIDEESSSSTKGVVKAALTGIIFKIYVKVGQKLKKDDKLFSLVAMKMENQILSPTVGKVKTIHVKKDEKVTKGDPLITIE